MNFDNVLEQILHEVVLHGDSYLQIGREPQTNSATKLTLLSGKDVVATLGTQPDRRSIWFGEREISGFVVGEGQDEHRLAPEDVIHAKSIRRMGPHSPYGESVIRIDLRSIYYLRKNRDRAAMQGNDWWINYMEDEVAKGMGVPRFPFEAGYAKYGKRNVEFASILFVANVRDAQRAVADAFEYQLFGQALGIRDDRELPSIKFKAFDTTRLLRDGGYGFAEEISGLKKAQEAGIITEKEYERNVKKFLGKE